MRNVWFLFSSLNLQMLVSTFVMSLPCSVSMWLSLTWEVHCTTLLSWKKQSGPFLLLSALKCKYVFFPNSDFPELDLHFLALARSLTSRLQIWPLALWCSCFSEDCPTTGTKFCLFYLYSNFLQKPVSWHSPLESFSWITSFVLTRNPLFFVVNWRAKE